MLLIWLGITTFFLGLAANEAKEKKSKNRGVTTTPPYGVCVTRDKKGVFFTKDLITNLVLIGLSIKLEKEKQNEFKR